MRTRLKFLGLYLHQPVSYLWIDCLLLLQFRSQKVVVNFASLGDICTHIFTAKRMTYAKNVDKTPNREGSRAILISIAEMSEASSSR